MDGRGDRNWVKRAVGQGLEGSVHGDWQGCCRDAAFQLQNPKFKPELWSSLYVLPES